MINVNIGAATQLSRHFVDLWYRNGTKGCIVNISSLLDLQPCPYGSVYGASKAYIRSFTLALQREVKPLGITVQLVSPDGVATKINRYSSWMMKGNLFIPTADAYAKWAVGTVGKSSATTGYFWHGIQVDGCYCRRQLRNGRLITKILLFLCRIHFYMLYPGV